MLPKRERNTILILLFLGWCLGNLDRYIMNYAVLQITEDLSLSASSTGIILSSFFLGYAIMQMPGGLLADKFGARKVLLASVILWSIFTGLTGAAWSLASMVLIRFLFGIGEGGFQPSSSKIISTTFPVAERGRAMSLMLSSGGIVALIVPVLSAFLLTAIGWRTTFIIFGAMGFVIAFLYWKFVRLPEDNPEEKLARAANPAEKGLVASLMKTPMIWNMVIAYFCIYAVNWGLATWIPSYLVQDRGLDLVSIGWVQTIPGVTMLLGVFLSGYVIDKLPQGREKIVAAVSCAMIGLMLYLMFTAPSVTAFITYQTIVNLFIAFVITVLPVIILKQLPTSVTGTAMGIANTGGQLAGFATPMAIGFVVDAFDGSFNAAFWMLITFALICIVAILTMRNKGELFDRAKTEAAAS
ncbi:MFS transporter [Bhargavaea massiliensis]|uniref:MFS transporter n=1 Tax=Bhargavaea massiliensis TaxID=2697500 RepID=UPI001BCAF1F8|nr:MFS transporter [Bhargavaea massiliensis]